MTQNERIIQILKHKPQGLTSLEASRLEPPIMRLSGRILELRREGYNIESLPDETEKAAFARYVLRPTQAQREWNLFRERCGAR